jgi:hypothetical protein
MSEPKKKAVKAKPAKTDDGMVTLATLAAELKIEPKVARSKLRKGEGQAWRRSMGVEGRISRIDEDQKAAVATKKALTANKVGSNLPQDGRSGPWVFEKKIKIEPSDGPRIGASSAEINSGIEKKGYFLWP